MALLDKGLKQRVVGALVLLALAVIFLPMLFSREDDVRQVVVEAPVMPKPPAMPTVEVQPTEVPEPQAEDAENGVPPAETAAAQAPSAPIASSPAQQSQSAQPKAPAPQPVAPKPAAPAQQPAQASAAPAAPAQQPAQRLDSNNLPVSWSVQLASLSNRARADELQKSLRSQGYNAYVRSFDGMNRVFVGPVVERAEADRLRDQLGKQQKLNGFVVRFQPERG
ncbi:MULTISPECIES: SPOR domain-containing protein [Pseudomonas]|uniref:SPOR domain-containing protein n=1 Tax=Pseudomonas nitroreducens TaxID=46680 RepID=A0A6G6J0X8_PSENT|nr:MULTISPECIES: SPOR domain-containing protein [Pseudomonas]MBG6285956.1 SPOR domain-containing protein [Pseudomonas nitroreducens]MDG9856452.1 SPOR domain-containing protein [Pseudomonas nitroreducens]NMZ57723.1 SPOR domain-containing protein [Pseudomonas nitroreducens]OBY59271.1 cell division protein [Pseudomonas sp. AU12215]QIE88877.1 SPOR domain-containing protein [Pseudomonas nitroreducens]